MKPLSNYYPIHAVCKIARVASKCGGITQSENELETDIEVDMSVERDDPARGQKGE